MALISTSLDAIGNPITNIWPPKLESLCLSPRQLYHPFSAPTPTLRGFLQSLPPTLTHLSLNVLDTSASSAGPPALDASVLPPRLTSLTLRIVAMAVGTFPTSLRFLDARTELSFNIPSFPDSLWSLKLNVDPYGNAPPLPSLLVTLTATYWSTKWFELIPKSVTFLDLESLGYINGAKDCFHVLPNALQTLKVKQFWSDSLDLSTNIGDFDFSSLINLKTLVLPTISIGTIPTLPRGLHSLKSKETIAIPVQVSAKLPRHLHCIKGLEVPIPEDIDEVVELVQHFPPFAFACLPFEQEFKELPRARLRDAF